MSTIREEAESFFLSLKSKRGPGTDRLEPHLDRWEIDSIRQALEEYTSSQIDDLMPIESVPVARLQFLVTLGQADTVSGSLRERLKSLISEKRWSQAKIATHSGIAQGQISRFIHGGVLKSDAIDRLALLLGASVDFETGKAFQAL